MDWQQQAGLVSTWDRNAVNAWWDSNPVGKLKPAQPTPVPKPNPNPPPNVGFTETSTFGPLPSTLSAKVGLIPLYFQPFSGGVSVWEFQYTDAGSNHTKIGILKLYHHGLLTPEKLNSDYSREQAAIEHAILWNVWQKVGLFAPDGAAIMSARDTALVSLDAADVEKLKYEYSNSKIPFPKVALYGVIMRKYGEDLTQVVKPSDKWPEKDVLGVLKAVGLALQVFHVAGRVHGDVKNLNVLRSVDGGKGTYLQPLPHTSSSRPSLTTDGRGIHTDRLR